MRRAVWVALVPLLVAACAEADQPPDALRNSRTPGDFALEEYLSLSSMVDGAVPDWSPDGSEILFVGRGTLWTVPSQGGIPQAIPAQAVTDPRYSPDG